MAIDAGLFAQLGTRPRSYGDYRQEVDTQAANALALKGGNLQYQNALQAMQDEAAYRDAARGFGADQTANYNALLQRGLPKQAMALQAQALKARETEANIGQSNASAAASTATAGKTRIDAMASKLGYGQKVLQTASSPDQAALLMKLGIDQGIFSQQEASAFLDDMPADMNEFNRWRNENAMQGMDMAKKIELQRQAQAQAETERHNRAGEGLTASGQGLTRRGQDITLRGQNLTDSRMRETTAAARDNTAATREATAAQRKEAANEKAVTKFADTLQKEGIPDIEAALGAAESIFAKYTDPKTGKLGDVPGVGAVKNALPDWAVSSEGKDVRESLSAVANIVLAARSGAAVTDQELRRLARELSNSIGASPADMQRAYSKFRARFEKTKANAAAGVSDEVKGEYEARGGIPITRGGATPKAAANADLDAALKQYLK